jgi:hypothetical protein
VNFIASTISLFVIVPLITLLFFYFILVKLVKRPKRAFLVAADLTTFFLIYSVYSLVLVLWGYGIGWWIFLLYIVVLLFVVIVFWQLHEEVNIKKSLRIAWRFHFLFYLLTHVSLFVYGIINSMIKSI